MCQHPMVDEPHEQPIPDSEEKGIRVPLSLGEVKEDFDKKGKICQVYDIVWNPKSVKNALEDGTFKQVMIEFAIAHIKQKKNHTLNPSNYNNRIHNTKAKI
jgi:hypothetical protein